MTHESAITVSLGIDLKLPLTPGHGVHWLAGEGAWEVRSEEAEFRTTRGLPLPGWYMIELTAERSVTTVAAGLFLEAGKRSVRIDMPLRVGKVTKRLVYVPRGVRRIRFRPMNAEGRFRLQHFRLVWVTPAFARDRLVRRLINAHAAYRDRTPREVVQRLREAACRQALSWRQVALREYETTFVSLCSRRNYRHWVETLERRPDALAVGDGLATLSPPSVLVVLPMGATSSPSALQATLASLRGQAVTTWRAVAVVADPVRQAALADELAREPGLRVAGQACPAPHEWVLCMSPGDRLADQALHSLAAALEANPRAQLVYGDEDRIDAEGGRQAPRFKPAWNPDLLLSQAYLGRAVFFRGDAWQALAAGREPPGGRAPEPWVHELALGFLARWGEQAAARCAHVGRILYHALDALPGVPAEHWPTLVRHHLQERGLMAEVGPGLLPGSVRVRWPLPEPAPLVSLLVPTRDGVEILRPCVDAILERTAYRHFELLILDNQSRCPETLAYMAAVSRRDPRVRVLRWDHPFNYSAINNFGASQARGSVIGLINNDVEPIDGAWLDELVSQACRPDIGCVGAKLYYPDGTIQHAGVILGLGGVAGHAHRFFQRHEEGYGGRLKLVQNLSAVTAACLLLRREVFDAVGGLNESDLAVAYNDVDLCLKVREAGYRNLWTPHAELYHHESVSRGADDTPKKRARALREADYMRRTWGKLLDTDPAYNPNLTLIHEDFSLR
ncbi:glycosyltransferase family 2 protein [Halomonas kalidii]|uniref:Glycosyltransferase family 2 protein n=1 Tax=Halomonas kalidii TaxID=3043293 RepID=A0ABT6VGD3_9GAMM|nr:glycosyltransferase family 2 protein [Halomonas kalidii]MDI5933043.1 glycosyltransferase family 2 protein [Halomonas kalidii]